MLLNYKGKQQSLGIKNEVTVELQKTAVPLMTT